MKRKMPMELVSAVSQWNWRPRPILFSTFALLLLIFFRKSDEKTFERLISEQNYTIRTSEYNRLNVWSGTIQKKYRPNLRANEMNITFIL